MQYNVSTVCWLQTKIHYCFVLRHRGRTDERLGQDEQWRDEEKEGDGERGGGLHEETGDREGGMREKVGVSMVSQ